MFGCADHLSGGGCVHRRNWYGQWDFTLALIGVSLLTMLVGFVDDFIKVVKKRSLGLICRGRRSWRRW